MAVANHLRANPGLTSRREELLADNCDEALRGAVAETNLPGDTFPDACPHSLDRVTDPEFWPGGAELPVRAPRRRR